MPKIYIGITLILLLGLAFWYHGNSNYQSGVNAERVRWQDQLLKDLTKRAKAEEEIVKERVVWRERKEKIIKVPVACVLPADLISLLREPGIFTGGQVRHPVNQ